MTLPQTQTMTVNYIFLLNILCNTTINTAVTSAQIEVMTIFFVSCHPFPYIILLWNKVPWCSTRVDMPLYCVPTCECETTVTEAKINLKSEMTVAVEMGDMIVELIWKHCPLFGHIVNVFLFISLFITLTDSSVYWFVMGFRSVSPHFQNSKKWPCSEYWIL